MPFVHGQDAGVHTADPNWMVKLAPGLKRELEAVGFRNPELYLTDMGLALRCGVVLSLTSTSEQATTFTALVRVMGALKHSLLQVGLQLPMIVVLEPASDATLLDGPKGLDRFRRVVSEWARDQRWHGGEFALLAAPLVPPADADWKGPRSALDLIGLLLTGATASSQVAPVRMVSTRDILEGLQVDRVSPGNSDIRGLIVALRGLLRPIEDTQVSASRRPADDQNGPDPAELASSSREPTEAEFGKAFDAWYGDLLSIIRSSSGAKEHPNGS